MATRAATKQQDRYCHNYLFIDLFCSNPVGAAIFDHVVMRPLLASGASITSSCLQCMYTTRGAAQEAFALGAIVTFNSQATSKRGH